MGLVCFAQKFPHTFYVVAALILFLGVTAAVEMPPDIFPEINIPVVSVIWQYTGSTPPRWNSVSRPTASTRSAPSSTAYGTSTDYGTEVEVNKGVKDGDKVILQPPVNLARLEQGAGRS